MNVACSTHWNTDPDIKRKLPKTYKSRGRKAEPVAAVEMCLCFTANMLVRWCNMIWSSTFWWKRKLNWLLKVKDQITHSLKENKKLSFSSLTRGWVLSCRSVQFHAFIVKSPFFKVVQGHLELWPPPGERAATPHKIQRPVLQFLLFGVELLGYLTCTGKNL